MTSNGLVLPSIHVDLDVRIAPGVYRLAGVAIAELAELGLTPQAAVGRRFRFLAHNDELVGEFDDPVFDGTIEQEAGVGFVAVAERAPPRRALPAPRDADDAVDRLDERPLPLIHPVLRMVASGGLLSLLFWPAAVFFVGAPEYLIATLAFFGAAVGGGWWTIAGFRRLAHPRPLSPARMVGAIIGMLGSGAFLLPAAVLLEFMLLLSIDPTHGH